MKKNKWLTILIILSAILLLVAAAISLFTPNQTQIEVNQSDFNNVDYSQSDFNEIQFTGEFTLPVDKFPIFSFQQKENNIQDLILTLKNKYQLEQTAYSENIYLGDEYTLSYSPLENLVSLSSNLNSDTTTVAEEREAIEVANNFLNDLFPENQYDLLKTKYYTSEGHLAPSSPLRATLIEFQFFYQLNEYPAYPSNQTEAPITIMINNSYKVQKAVISPVMLDYQTLFEKNLITLEAALENINTLNLGSLIRVTQEQTEPVDLTSVASGDLTKVSIEYRTDDSNQLIYPFYRFEGEFLTNTGSEFAAYLITPAIKIQLED